MSFKKKHPIQVAPSSLKFARPMTSADYIPERILIDASVRNNPRVDRILSRCPDVPVTVLPKGGSPDDTHRYDLDPVTAGKRTLFLGANRGGHQLRRCPGMGETFLCCNYYVINVVENCHFECSYCFLQSYLTSKVIKFYVNLDDVFDQLDAFYDSHGNKTTRVGTGELSDSLGLEHLHGFSGELIERFQRYPNAILELKTKSDNVAPILDVAHAGNVVVSWSINPEGIADREERATASLSARLSAAAAVADAGYRVAFHFDPMIATPTWESEYQALVEQIFAVVPAESIAWVSMGGLRLNQGLKHLVRERHPESAILRSEYVMGPDKKLKYPKPLRETMFSTLKGWIESRAPQTVTYLCMEAPGTWETTYGEVPAGPHRLDAQFAKRIAALPVLQEP